MNYLDRLKTMSYIDPTKLTMLPLSQIELNDGQLDGLPKNPRSIKKDKFQKLKNNIEAYPEMLAWRSLLVYPLDNDKYIIIGGNMRYRAMTELGHTEAPVFIIPKGTPVERLQAYTIIDNNGFGEWEWDLLANEWPDDMLDEWGLDVPNMDCLEEPEELDGERETKAFVAKITFKSETALNEFQQMYGEQLTNEYDCIISVSGGKL